MDAQTHTKQFPCGQCGAELTYDPAVAMVKCGHCGFENPIAPSDQAVEELDFHAHLEASEREQPTQEARTVQCTSCAAEFTLEAHTTAGACPFCGTAIVAQGRATTVIRPGALLPFGVPRDQAAAYFRRWLESRWFAPGQLKQYARADSQGLNGVYVPYWTYDCRTLTHYTGERGEDYWTTETYTAVENGKHVTRTRRVRRTRWYSVRGIVNDAFDDVLILASRSLPDRCARKLEPWDLANLVPYDDQYLAGFRAQSHQVTLREGFREAAKVMEATIRRSICHDIGGDHQRIHSMRTQYFDITFKHVLLPVWISAYRYRDEVFRFLVNARTGEVQGERPWSWAKIVLLVLLIALAVGLLVLLFVQYTR